jgi:hypothetical protein
MFYQLYCDSLFLQQRFTSISLIRPNLIVPNVSAFDEGFRLFAAAHCNHKCKYSRRQVFMCLLVRRHFVSAQCIINYVTLLTSSNPISVTAVARKESRRTSEARELVA